MKNQIHPFRSDNTGKLSHWNFSQLHNLQDVSSGFPDDFGCSGE